MCTTNVVRDRTVGYPFGNHSVIMRNRQFFDFADPELGTWTINHDMFGVVRNYALGALSCAINTFLKQYLMILLIVKLA